MSYPRTLADFHNADTARHLRLNYVSTIEDLARQNIELQVSQLLTLYSEELEFVGAEYLLISYSNLAQVTAIKRSSNRAKSSQ